MARIPYLDPDGLPESLRSLGDGRVINLFRILLHSPDVPEPFTRLAAAQFSTSSLTVVDRELIVLASAQAFDATYVWDHHVPLSEALGVTSGQRAAIAVRDVEAAVFSPAQTALLRFVHAVAEAPHVSEELFEATLRHLTHRQAVEAMLLVGLYFMTSRITTVLEIESDPLIGDEVERRVAQFIGQ